MVKVQIPPRLKDLFTEAGIGSGGDHTYTDFFSSAVEEYLPTVEAEFADRSKGRPKDDGFESFRVEIASALYAQVKELKRLRKAFKQVHPRKIRFTNIRSIEEEVIARKFACEWESFGLKDKKTVQDATGYSPDMGEQLRAELRKSVDVKASPTDKHGEHSAQSSPVMIPLVMIPPVNDTVSDPSVQPTKESAPDRSRKRVKRKGNRGDQK